MLSSHNLAGAWRLTLCEARDADGSVLLPLGRDPVGLLLYSAEGTMSVALMRVDRQAFRASDILAGTLEEKASASEGYLSYAGRFELRGASVLHHIEVSLFPNWVGTTQERLVELAADSLALSTNPVVFGGRTRVARMAFRRVGHGDTLSGPCSAVQSR